MASNFCADGHENLEKAKFCIVCGLPITSADSTEHPAAADLPTSPDQPTEILAAVDLAEAEPKSPVNLRKWLLISGAALVALLLVGGGTYLLTTTPATDVVGMTEAEAIAALEEQGLSAAVQDEEFSDTIPKDSIAAQEPSAGSRVGSGTEIVLILSRGPARTVPSVEGESYVKAMQSVKQASLEAARTEETSETIPEGTVISQSPAAGTELEDGDTVQLLVSSGPPRTTLTYVSDLSSIVSDLSYANCRLAVSLWNITYSNSVVQDQDERTISSISGSWTASSLNGTYYPCYAIGEFPDTPTNEDRYRVAFDETKADRNSSAWYSQSEMEAEDWNIGG